MVKLHEKPSQPPSSWICPPLYFFQPSVWPILECFLTEPGNHDAPGYLDYLCRQETVMALKLKWFSTGYRKYRLISAGRHDVAPGAPGPGANVRILSLLWLWTRKVLAFSLVCYILDVMNEIAAINRNGYPGNKAGSFFVGKKYCCPGVFCDVAKSAIRKWRSSHRSVYSPVVSSMRSALFCLPINLARLH